MPAFPRPTLNRPAVDLRSFTRPTLDQDLPGSVKDLAYTAVGLNVLAFDELRSRLAARGVDLGREIGIARERAETNRRRWQQQLDEAGEQLQSRVAAMTGRPARTVAVAEPVVPAAAPAAATKPRAGTKAGAGTKSRAGTRPGVGTKPRAGTKAASKPRTRKAPASA
jgi:hypothetical protein